MTIGLRPEPKWKVDLYYYDKLTKRLSYYGKMNDTINNIIKHATANNLVWHEELANHKG